ncbi:nucleoside-diphosphate kinase [Carnobacterium divergens]|uniref:nucleoside-diphosphate kinase n=1 Tax=Carnobacterium divergens TaxID=2748 RepID=UPI000D3F4298|nr:nucleoside-diphosphate kinase [Carnobacterium divergens]MCO6019381.1 nucleoside-diphosphate kinase [Carnobacterium divergens]SPC41092.1 putative Nucleoside diphosphate kinase [Carnobacterium divergens]
MEQTLIILKPDCLEREIVSKVTSKLLEKGTIKKMSYLRVTNDKILKHYEENLKNCPIDITHRISNYFVNKQVIVIILEGKDICKKMRDLIGASDPENAEVGTIRHDFGIDSYDKALSEKRSCENIIHASDNPKEFRREYSIWFPKEDK